MLLGGIAVAAGLNASRASKQQLLLSLPPPLPYAVPCCSSFIYCAVGVITPYREQRKLLRQTFEEVCGKGPASEVRAALYYLLASSWIGAALTMR